MGSDAALPYVWTHALGASTARGSMTTVHAVPVAKGRLTPTSDAIAACGATPARRGLRIDHHATVGVWAKPPNGGETGQPAVLATFNARKCADCRRALYRNPEWIAEAALLALSK